MGGDIVITSHNGRLINDTLRIVLRKVQTMAVIVSAGTVTHSGAPPSHDGRLLADKLRLSAEWWQAN